jgi:hypothetical protein
VSTSYAIKPYSGPLHAKPKKKVPDAAPIALGAPKRLLDGYYDFGPVLSHNCILNFIAGARGIGKTFGAKRLAINKWIKKREQFIYLRRFDTELPDSVPQYFADIQHLYPDWDFKAEGRKFYAAPANTRDAKKRDWEVIGFALALSTSQNRKSVSYIRVRTVIFDEFILEKSAQHYLPNEAEIFINFVNTVDRGQDDTVFLCLANAVTVDNPYNVYFSVLPPQPEDAKDPKKQLVKDKSAANFWLFHFPDSAEFQKSMAETRFGQFIQGTSYYDYAVANQFKDNHLHLVATKGENALHFFNLETRAGMMSIWQDIVAGKWYALSRIPQGQLTLTMMPERMTEEKTLVFDNDDIILNLMSAFRTKRLYFDTPATRNIFLDLFKTSRSRS